MSRQIKLRAVIAGAILLAATVLLHSVSHGEQIPIHRPLAQFPMTIGRWHGQDDPYSQHIVRAVGVDDYINRDYSDGQGPMIDLYVGYYETQQKGDIIHSPKNCLPGAGWEPVSGKRAMILITGRQSIPVNEYVIRKGLDELLVVYWYQEQGRAIASEYWGKFWLVADAMTRNRTDGALIRISMPVGNEFDQSRASIIRFVQLADPKLQAFLPR